MDNLNELGKELAQTNKNTEDALRRIYPNYPLVHQARDIFDYVYPFELEFETPKSSNAQLSLIFRPPPANVCSSGGVGCVVGVCEYYFTNDSQLLTSYDYIANSVKIYKNKTKQSSFTESGTGEITLSFSHNTDDEIKVCYIYLIEDCS